ncbi:hypothetical protein FEP65_01366 [Burkholderia multivorans]|nr:hypothetical protein [Burkholderia multivorans]
MASGRGQQQQPRRLDRVTGDHDVARALEMRAAVAPVMHARHAIALRVDPQRHREVAHFGAGRDRARNPRDQRALLRVGRAAGDAEAAIHARMRAAARRGQRRERRRRPVDAERLGAAREHERGRVQFMGAVRVARARRSPGIVHRPADLQRLLDFAVVAPHLAPVERPVDAVTEQRARAEPFGPKAQRHHREVHGAAADRAAAVVGAERQRVRAVANPLVGPEQLALVRFVGGEFLQRPPPCARIERDDGKTMLGKPARERAAARAGADDHEVDRLVVAEHSHRRPAAHAQRIGRAAVATARLAGVQRISVHRDRPPRPSSLPTDRAG